MSRCTPSSNISWNRRLKRHGGLAGLAAKRTEQFAKLSEVHGMSLHIVEAARIKGSYGELDSLSQHQLKKATNALDLAKLAYDFLTGNARRVLPIAIEEALGWR
jgi:hypothetical protein